MTPLQTLTSRGRKHLGLVAFVGIQLILFSCSNVDHLNELPIDFQHGAKDQISQAVHSVSKIKRNLSFFLRILFWKPGFTTINRRYHRTLSSVGPPPL